MAKSKQTFFAHDDGLTRKHLNDVLKAKRSGPHDETKPKKSAFKNEVNRILDEDDEFDND
jgi:hypothetical protein